MLICVVVQILNALFQNFISCCCRNLLVPVKFYHVTVRGDNKVQYASDEDEGGFDLIKN